MLMYILIITIAVLLAAILGAVKLGFNEVITGLQAIHSELKRQGRGRSEAGRRDVD